MGINRTDRFILSSEMDPGQEETGPYRTNKKKRASLLAASNTVNGGGSRPSSLKPALVRENFDPGTLDIRVKKPNCIA